MRESDKEAFGLPALESVDALAPQQIPAFLGALTALLGRAAVRLALDSSQSVSDAQRGSEALLTIDEVAKRTGMSKDWLYRNARRLPFARRIGRRTLRFSESALERWMANRAPAS